MENKFNYFNFDDKKEPENNFRCDDFIQENFVRAEVFRYYALQSFTACKEKCNNLKVKKCKSRYIDKYKNTNV